MRINIKFKLFLLFLLSLGGYLLIGYGIDRSQFAVFITAYAILFACYYVTVYNFDDSTVVFRWLVGAAVLFRFALLFSIPTLSDDFYRFIWDGNLLTHGLNPFAHAPEFYMQNGLPDFLSADLFRHMNSQGYYSVYPPVSQLIYSLSASLFGTQLLGNVVVLRVFMVAAELGTLWVLRALLLHFRISRRWLFIYALNPLVILELTGNLHFEALMIFFLLFGYYLYLNKRSWAAATCLLLAVNVKLIPLIMLPYLCFSLGWKKSFGLIGMLLFGTLVLHIPFLDSLFIDNFTGSLGLYFQKFEFNASIYYLARWVGFQVKGYNIIHTLGPALAILSTAVILVVSWKYRRSSLKNLPAVYIVIFGIYYLCSTTVHPWYVSSLVAFVPLSGFLYSVAWSALIPLTYMTYTTAAYTENLWFVAIEYAFVFGVIWYDWYHRKEPVSDKLRIIKSDK